jgi:hypothetical protein
MSFTQQVFTFRCASSPPWPSGKNENDGLCDFLRQTTADPSKGTYKLLAICSSESYLFEPPKKDTRGRPERRPWGELEHNVFMAVVPEVPLIPKTGAPLRWFETELPKNGSIYWPTQWKSDEN